MVTVNWVKHAKEYKNKGIITPQGINNLTNYLVDCMINCIDQSTNEFCQSPLIANGNSIDKMPSAASLSNMVNERSEIESVRVLISHFMTLPKYKIR